jgi:hypothetical protein
MGHRLSLFGIAAICLIAVGCGHQDADTGPARTAIQAAYDAQCAAYEHHDEKGVVAWCAPNYEEIDGQQVTELPQTRQELASAFRTLGPVHARASVLVVQLDGNQASVAVNRHSEMTILPHGNEKAHQIVIDESDTDSWIDVPGQGWRKQRSVTVAHQSTRDGQPVTD